MNREWRSVSRWQGVDIDFSDVTKLPEMVRKETAVVDKVIREANIHVN